MFAKYKIRHHTRYRYSEPVAICQNQLRMLPRSRERLITRVECHQSSIEIRPKPEFANEHRDYFGNRAYTFAIEKPHRELDVMVSSLVSVYHDEFPTTPIDRDWAHVVEGLASGQESQSFELQEFYFDSPRVRRDPRFASYASESFTPGRSIEEAVLDLTQRIHDEFHYDTQATCVDTSTEEAFALRAGVCQDFAHIQIACLRSIGIPAMYVSGYLRTMPRPGEKPAIGADESHAWVSVYLGREVGWIDYDPTNACRCSVDHIPISVGRDFSEVSPMRGVVLGGGATQLSVHVDVELLDEGSSHSRPYETGNLSPR